MALTTVTVNGILNYPDGTIVTSGSVTFTLSGVTSDDTTKEVVKPEPGGVKATIQSDGTFSVSLWPNSRGTSTTYYTVTGPDNKTLGKISVPESGAPHDLGSLLLAGIPAQNAVYMGVITQAQYDAAIQSKTDAEAARDAAAISAAQAALYDGPRFDTVADLLADTTLTYTSGSETTVSVGGIVEAEGFRYEVAASSASDEHVTTAGGVKLYALPGDNGYNLKAFGAVGDGVTDDSGALNTAVNHVINNNAVLYAPRGEYRLFSAVDITDAPETHFSVVGAGVSVTKFIVDSTNTTGAIRVATTSRKSQAWFRDFSIVGDGTSGGTALRWRMPEGGNQHQRSATLENITVEGKDGVDDYFTWFIDLTGNWRPLLSNVLVSGPYIGADNQNSSHRFSSATGIVLGGSYSPTLIDVRVWGSSVGISSKPYTGNIVSVANNGSGFARVTIDNPKHPFSTGSSVTITGSANYDGKWVSTNISSTEFDIDAPFVGTDTGSAHISNGPEAIYMDRVVVNGCKTGIDWFRYSREPVFHIYSSHMNFRNDGLKIDGAKLIVVDGLEFYNEDDNQYYTGIPKDLNFKNVSEYRVSNSAFHYNGNPSRIPIFVESETTGEGDNGVITGNIFTCNRDYSVWLSLNCDNVIVGPNVYKSPATIEEVHDVSGGNEIIDGLSITSGTWTPTLSFGGSSAGISYVTQTGTWRISGGVLHINIEIKLSSKGSSTGIADISLPTNFPGTLSIQQDSGVLTCNLFSGMSGVNAQIVARPTSATSARLLIPGASATANLTDSYFTNNSRIILSGSLMLG